MKTVDNFPDLAAAQSAVSLLRAEGIDAAIVEEHHAGLNWQIGTALQGVRVQVDDDVVESARELLALHVRPDPDQNAPPADDRDFCPACRSDAVVPAPWKRRAKTITMVFPALILLWPLLTRLYPRYACRACGHRWN